MDGPLVNVIVLLLLLKIEFLVYGLTALSKSRNMLNRVILSILLFWKPGIILIWNTFY